MPAIANPAALYAPDRFCASHTLPTRLNCRRHRHQRRQDSIAVAVPVVPLINLARKEPLVNIRRQAALRSDNARPVSRHGNQRHRRPAENQKCPQNDRLCRLTRVHH